MTPATTKAVVDDALGSDSNKATATKSGTIKIATQAEAKAGTDNTSAMTPATTKAVVDDALGSDSNKATATKSGTVKLGNRALANDGSTVLGYFVNV